MNPNSTRKTDRRTLYTQNVIKDAMLELLGEMSFDKISVSALCRQAEITRPTFYLHYDNLMQVLDSMIEDALGNISGNLERHTFEEDRALLSDLSNPRKLEKNLTLTPCQRGPSDPKYNILFTDPTLYNYIVERIYRERLEAEIPSFMAETGLSRKLTEKLICFTIHGSFAMNRSFQWKKDRDWYRAHRMILTFLMGGFEALRRDKELNE